MLINKVVCPVSRKYCDQGPEGEASWGGEVGRNRGKGRGSARGGMVFEGKRNRRKERGSARVSEGTDVIQFIGQLSATCITNPSC